MSLWKKIFSQEEPILDDVINEEKLKADVDQVDNHDVEVVMEKEEAIDKKLSNASPLKKYAELGRLMISLVKDFSKGEYKQVPWFTIGTIAMALLYILNPLDLVPDFIPGFGYVDDLTVLSVGLGWIESDLHSYLDWKLSQNSLTS